MSELVLCVVGTSKCSRDIETCDVTGDDATEITATNRPRDTFYDWFLNPFLIMKEQIKAENLSDEEEDYLGKLVLLCGEPERLRSSNIGSPPGSEVKRAELDALARR